jgi:hypothetical protein
MNPYAPPKAAVAAADGRVPSEWQRVKKVFTGMCAALAFLTAFNFLLKPPPAPDAVILALNCALALGLGVFIGRDIWLLKVRRSPLAVDILLYAVMIGGAAALVAVKELGIYDWNSLHLDLPMILVLGVPAALAWLTEARKRVRVYFGARQFVFVHGPL